MVSKYNNDADNGRGKPRVTAAQGQIAQLLIRVFASKYYLKVSRIYHLEHLITCKKGD
ncbi:MAG: hypothetical protein PHI68_05730 [Candidatus Cloacimonetes bacterium]|nr:hypothetical protein [Candidatus Cloacimonadota bacterium]